MSILEKQVRVICDKTLWMNFYPSLIDSYYTFYPKKSQQWLINKTLIINTHIWLNHTVYCVGVRIQRHVYVQVCLLALVVCGKLCTPLKGLPVHCTPILLHTADITARSVLLEPDPQRAPVPTFLPSRDAFPWGHSQRVQPLCPHVEPAMRGMWCVNSSPPTLDIGFTQSHIVSPPFHFTHTHAHTHSHTHTRTHKHTHNGQWSVKIKHRDVNHTFGGVSREVKGAAE